MEDLIEGNRYLVAIEGREPMRIATFNGFGETKGWGGRDWSGDSGHSTDSWMHEEVEWYLPLNKLVVNVDGQINGNTGLVTSISIRSNEMNHN